MFHVKHHYPQTHDDSQGLINYAELPRLFHVKHYGVGRFVSWLFESVASSLVVVGVGVSRGTWKFVWADLLGLVAVALRSGIVFP